MSSCCPARPGRIVGDIVDTVTGVVASDVAAPGADNVAAPADVAATYVAPANVAAAGANNVAATVDVAASTAADNVPALTDAEVVVKPSV